MPASNRSRIPKFCFSQNRRCFMDGSPARIMTCAINQFFWVLNKHSSRQHPPLSGPREQLQRGRHVRPADACQRPHPGGSGRNHPSLRSIHPQLADRAQLAAVRRRNCGLRLRPAEGRDLAKNERYVELWRRVESIGVTEQSQTRTRLR